MRTLVPMCVLSLLLAAAAHAQSDDSRNAATWYRKAFERLDSIAISQDEWEALRQYWHDRTGAPPPQVVREVLARAQPVFSAVRRGSRQEFSDFGLDYSQGFGLLLPALSKFRKVAELMFEDARVQLHDGNSAAAAAELAMLYRMADHVSDDQIIISSLSGQAIFQGGDRVAQWGLDRGAFSAADSAKLLEAIKQLDSKDPFDYVGALVIEKEFTTDWLRETYADAADRATMFDDLGMKADDSTLVAGLMMVDQAQFDMALDQVELLMDRVIEVFALDDPVEAQFELEQIGEEVRRGDHGALAMILVPAYSKIYKLMTKAERQIAERTALLQAIVAGTVTPAELVNAAVWYLRAIEMLNTIEPARRQHFRTVLAHPERPIGEEAAKTLAQATAIIEMLRTGSRKSRCDFSIARRGAPPAIPSYLPGLRDAARLLDADAIRLLQRKDMDAAADRLTICYRLSAHLAGDKIITSSLVSHAMFAATDALTRRALARNALSDTQRSALLGAVEAMSRKDPFGYIGSLISAREQVQTWIAGRIPARGEAAPPASEMVRRWDGDQLLYLLVVIRPPSSAGDAAAAIQDDALRPLDDVISRHDLALALSQAQEVRQAVESGNLDLFSQRPLPQIARVRDRLESARGDLRRSVFALKTEKTSNSAPRK